MAERYRCKHCGHVFYDPNTPEEAVRAMERNCPKKVDNVMTPDEEALKRRGIIEKPLTDYFMIIIESNV